MAQKNSSTFAIYSISIREVASRASGEFGVFAWPTKATSDPIAFGEFRRATMIDFFDRSRTYFVE
jgi:hypothetical protein